MSQELYTPTEDHTETLPDGRTIQVATKGVPMLRSEAERVGLVKPHKGAQPAETKEGAPAEAKRTSAKTRGE